MSDTVGIAVTIAGLAAMAVVAYDRQDWITLPPGSTRFTWLASTAVAIGILIIVMDGQSIFLGAACGLAFHIIWLRFLYRQFDKHLGRPPVATAFKPWSFGASADRLYSFLFFFVGGVGYIAILVVTKLLTS